MFASRCLLSHSRLDAKSELTDFLQHAGYVMKESSGFYSYTTLGLLALHRIEERLRSHLQAQSLAEWSLSLLQTQDVWDKTGRARDYGEELMSVTLRSKHVMRLSATAEEQITNLVSQHLQGRHVDHHFFQLGTKWRDEIRARGDLVRGREFRMMDAYHFCDDHDVMTAQNDRIRAALVVFLQSFGCTVRAVEADCGEIGGLASQELQVQTDLSEDGWLEVGHCFALGDRYARAFDFKSATGKDVLMSCQGLGTSRLLAVVLGARRQGVKLCGDEMFGALDDVVLGLGQLQSTKDRARQLHDHLVAQGRVVMLDDRFDRAGQQLAGSESLCAVRRWVVSDRLGEGVAEVHHFATSLTSVETLSF